MAMKVKPQETSRAAAPRPSAERKTSAKPGDATRASRAMDGAAPVQFGGAAAINGELRMPRGTGLAGGESIELFARPETNEERGYQQRFGNSRAFLDTMTQGKSLSSSKALGEPEVRINGERVVVRAPVLDAMMGQPMGAPLVRELSRAELEKLLGQA